ncbi:MAG: hypothetical protein PHQ23_04625 [Candidatus Wallbacteria bacterium]|nr:hypothetical protein [Candidatus Wallbacteria bacterium]
MASQLFAADNFYAERVSVGETVEILWQLKPDSGYAPPSDTRDTSVSLTARVPYTLNTLLEKPYITIFIDKSGSMQYGFNDLKTFLSPLIKGLPESFVKFVLFDNRHHSTDFCINTEALLDLSQVTTRGSSRIWDLLYFEAKRQKTILAPKFFVLLSDGHDQAMMESPRPYSRFKITDVAKEMDGINARGISVSFGPDPDSEELNRFSGMTGGACFHSPPAVKVIDFINEKLEYFYHLQFIDPYAQHAGTKRKMCLSVDFLGIKTTDLVHNYDIRKDFLDSLPGRKPDEFSLHMTKMAIDKFPLTSIYFQVYDSAEVVRDLTRDEIELYLQADVFRNWRNIEIPVHLTLLLDQSGSLKDQAEHLKDSAAALINAFPGNVSTEIFVLNRDYPYFSRISAGEIQGLSYSGPTPLFDSMYHLILRMMELHERKRLLAITDGWDEYFEGTHNRMSKKNAVEVINLAFESNVKLSILPAGPVPNLRTLRHMAESTLGEIFRDPPVSASTLLSSPEIYRFLLSFPNPFWATSIPVRADITVPDFRFRMLYQGEEWKLTPLP